MFNHRPVYFLLLAALFTTVFSIHSFAQLNSKGYYSGVPFLPEDKDNQLYGTGSRFIENIGQYGTTLKEAADIGAIKYGFEGFGMPVLFTPRGMVLLQRKVRKLSEKEKEEAEKKGVFNKEVEEGFYYKDKRIILEWIGANPNAVISGEQATSNYYVYASVNAKARGFKKIVYHDLYPGIDLVYTFSTSLHTGFEYNLIVRPGGDPSKIKLRLGGDAVKWEQQENGDVITRTDIDGLLQTAPRTYYCGKDCSSKSASIVSSFIIEGKELRFDFPEGYDRSRTILIDPFVSATSSLTGENTGVAKDIDFDYDGNIYVSGGGNMSINLLAKFNPNGVLLWTFNGSLSVPSWNFGNNYGGWVVEKTSGKTYLGQGGTSGFQIVRLNANGFYDNYVTQTNNALQENWKMIYNCEQGIARIMIAGGGSANEHINLAICSPPSTSLNQLNITGQPTGHQDMADLVLDPKTGDLYSIFAQAFVTPITENNRMYRHKPPFTPSAMQWTRLSGFNVLNGRANRPYLSEASGFNDNSINALAVNTNYLFYYDGFNLLAMDKSTGANRGSPITFPLNTVLHQGGIIADECNNVYVGSKNGTIKVYKFTGTLFDEAGAPDINIAGYPNAAIYDLAYDNAKNLLYAGGKGFIAAIDITDYCETLIYTLNVNADCVGMGAIASLSPALPTGSTVTYEVYSGNTLISSNNTGRFLGLLENVDYVMKALVDEACGGTQSIKSFRLVNCNAPGIGTGVYVPTGFTPNSDGRNDVLRAIPYGIREFKHFTIYNRWGEVVFRTTDPLRGWDGRVNGKMQNSGVFIWMVEVIDVYDKPLQLRGTTTLIY
jgi:gliding motility-associated-like protein